MKAAIVTDDGRTVSQHFGRAAYYLVVELAGGRAAGELRPRHTRHAAGAGHHDHGHEHGHQHGQGHGAGPEAAARHAAMAQQIGDCQILVAGGMGRGAVQAMEAAGIKVVLTELSEISEVLGALAAGELTDRRERMH
jgi:predicted Fe-Mo cluster-binding NifX family protein